MNCSTGVKHFIDPETGVLYDTTVSPNKKPPALWTVASTLLLASASASSNTIDALAIPTSSTASHTHETTSSGLSTASCIGIAISVAVAITAVGILAWLFLRERRTRMMLQKKQGPPGCPTPRMTRASRLPPQEVEDRFRSEAP